MPEATPHNAVTLADETVGTQREAAEGPVVPVAASITDGRRAAEVPLMSLAPEFVAPQHQSYLDRLMSVLTDERNRNIALTGRYGAGKSSVLDAYFRGREKTTLRLGISSLGPNDEGASLTNRIQKEIVKQLIYSAEPHTLARSQFRRPVELSRRRAAGEVAAVVALLGVFLVLMGWLPTPGAAQATDPPLQRIAVWLVIIGVVWTAGTALRLLTHEKLSVSDISAGGATVKLSEKKLTYFDEYLDLIVNFFDAESIDVVIFEDLDRFEDPQIYEALRELNTLLNGPRRGAARKGPMRFVYAVRDSLFEKIGTEPAVDPSAEAESADEEPNSTRPLARRHPAEVDAATAETVRANRTKFFDVVIPIVPFISHRNARDLLQGLLQESGVVVERGLVDLVARHCTDMRLLRNMRNEYLVFAERLLEGEQQAPELNSTKLFALVAYKNFHMDDFENIARRTSTLDTLIRHGVTSRELEKRTILRREASPPSLKPFARQLGTTLNTAVGFSRDERGYPAAKIRYRVGDVDYTSEAATTAAFWEDVVDAASLTVMLLGPNWSTTLTKEKLEEMFPNVLEGHWRARRLEAALADAAALDAEIAELRGAGFKKLVEASDSYRMPRNYAGVGGPGTVAATEAGKTPATEAVSMADRVHEVLDSELARDLVRRGFIDVNFSVYAAQFYGAFAGIDVHTFLIQTEQTNSSDIDYRFESEDSVRRLLDEASVDFTRSISAFNTDVLDWLLVHDREGAANVAIHLMETFEGSDLAQQFMATYFTSGKARPQLAALLAHEECRPTFTYLATSTDVPEDVRVDLVDAAVCRTHAKTVRAYDTPIEFANFLLSHYQEMSVFTAPQSDQVRAAAVVLLMRADVRLPNLADLTAGIRSQVVEQDLYELTAGNLRLAADVDGPVDLDHLRDAAPTTVYGYCLGNPGTYLAEAMTDSDTEHAICGAETLTHVLNTSEAASWSSTQLEEVLLATSANAALRDLRAVPSAMWKPLAGAGLFQATLGNVGAYLTEFGQIDAPLGRLLSDAGALTSDAGHEAEDAEQPQEAQATDDARTVAVAVLNARTTIPAPEQRVRLVAGLELDTPLTATEVAAETSDLFARLLQAELVADDEPTFNHLASGGWTAVRAAMMASEHVPTFLTPTHITGMVADVLDDHETAKKLGSRVLEDLDSFLTPDDQSGWKAVAGYALRSRKTLSWPHLQMIAAHSSGSAVQTMQLLELAAPKVEDLPQVLAVLSSLGPPWNYLSTREQNEFEAPADEPFDKILQLLQSQNVVKLGRRKKDGNRTVSLL